MAARITQKVRDLARPCTVWHQTRTVTYMPWPGDGIGPLVTGAVEQVMEAMHAPVFFEKYEVSGSMSKVPQEVLDSIKKNNVCLKGGLATPIGGGVSSLNVHLRKELDLDASLIHCFNIPGAPIHHDNVDIVIIKENTEGEYSGLEHEVVPRVVESLKFSMSKNDPYHKKCCKELYHPKCDV